uniref:Uncharacterized protein n=1 Tax=Melopsittacus undulatus TaxID=13146 RepID=A0A8V5GN45_MELUD
GTRGGRCGNQRELARQKNLKKQSDSARASGSWTAGAPVPCQHHGTRGCGFLLPTPLVR